ncbi:MAG: hypothetical protein JNM69_33820 [Archangium sp.]|nr:hypothetical protein [Archangium sp.]
MRFAASLLVLLLACTPPPPPTPGFDDHTRPSIDSLAVWEQLSVEAHGRAETKFVISEFVSHPTISFYDNHFYKLHDEWLMFRLLNGQPAPGVESLRPVTGQQFATIADLYAWAKTSLALPLGLQWVDDGRLYLPAFYDLALYRRPRSYGLGTLMHVAAKGPRPERWAFQLEFGDAVTHEELVTFFEAVLANVPPEVANNLWWLVRSPTQEAFAQTLEQQKLRFHDRILRQKDLTVPGEVEVYSAGLTAGRLLRLKSGASLESAKASSLLVLEDVPDFLPPASGVVTAVPQTPLAHFNLLARNRGIPNVYRAGVFEDAELETLAYYREPVVMSARAPDQLIVKQITDAQLQIWQSLMVKPLVAVTQVDVSALPYTADLRTLSLSNAETVRPAFGGKATGYLGLLAGAPDATPDALVGISIRSYAEHVAPLQPTLMAMLADGMFLDDARSRYLVLEGSSAFDSTYTTASDTTLKNRFLSSHPAGTALGDLARGSGLKGTIRERPIAPATLATITAALDASFGHYAKTQGLRFRSSSTAEDVEGFNGAGLYDSNTGYLDPASAPKSSDRTHGVEWALKKTWASYWSAEAFEERRLENVDHLSGNMAVVVHANFADDFEKSNGVFLFTLGRDFATMELNVQHLAVSVTNPTSTALPEIDRVTLDAASPGAPRIERLRSSTLVPAGVQLMDDAALAQTFARAHAVATAWLAQDNRSRTAAQKAGTLVLDFEFRHVFEGWPQLARGTPNPSRVVLKQARSLEHGVRTANAAARAQALPRDVFNRARRIERRTCQAEAFKVVVVEAFTDPLLPPDVGYATTPFTGSVTLVYTRDVPELQGMSGTGWTLEHPQLASTTHASTGGWELTATPTTTGANTTHVKALSLRADGSFSFVGESASFQGGGLTCAVEVLFSTPNEYLLSLL